MIIQKFSKDLKKGVVVGSNSLTPDKIAAGAITAATALAVSAAMGVFGSKKPSRAGAKRKKKKPLALLLLPMVYKAAKSAAQKKSLGVAVGEAVEKNSGVETVAAEAIGEGEVVEIGS